MTHILALIRMSQTSGDVAVANDEIATESALVETEDDIRALRALGLYGRRLPLPLIQQLGVSRATAYRLIRRGKALIRLESDDALPKVFLLSDDLIRECLIQYQQVENNSELTIAQKISLKAAILAQINAFLQTQIRATQAMTPKSETISVQTVESQEGRGTRIIVKREQPKLASELLAEILAEKNAKSKAKDG